MTQQLLAPQRLVIGETYEERFTVDEATVERFAQVSGDHNPIHVDAEAAKAYGYPRKVAHGALLTAFLSQMIGTKVPGAGAVWMNQSIEWLSPVFVGDAVGLQVTVERISTGTGILCLQVAATNQKGKLVMRGQAQVKLKEKLIENAPAAMTMERVALVTGGSRGIGAAITRRLAAGGVTVALNYRTSADEAEQLVEEIRSAGGRAQAFRADLSDSVATMAMSEEIVQSFGRLDAVIHGASPGIQPTKITDLRHSDLEAHFKVYITGALALLASASPGMMGRRFGRFIFLGTSALFGMPPAGWAPYLVAKHALWGLVRSMSVELGPWGITSNMVSPTMTVTDLTADISARMKEVEARKSPMRRLAAVEDTAELVAFLVSDAAGYINGVNLPLTGGAV